MSMNADFRRFDENKTLDNAENLVQYRRDLTALAVWGELLDEAMALVDKASRKEIRRQNREINVYAFDAVKELRNGSKYNTKEYFWGYVTVAQIIKEQIPPMKKLYGPFQCKDDAWEAAENEDTNPKGFYARKDAEEEEWMMCAMDEEETAS